MPVILAVPDLPASSQQITLDAVPYSLLLTWNERAGAWILGLLNSDGAAVLVGRRVVLDLDILSVYRYLPGVPTGGIFALDATGKIRSISRQDLILGNVVLWYYSRAELDGL